MDDVTIEAARSATDEIRALIDELNGTMAQAYAPEQQHGLALDALFLPPVRFFLARRAGVAVGCGGVAIFETFAEVKRMYVRERARGRGVADALLARIEGEAVAAGVRLLRLETGDRQYAAMRLYERTGFMKCSAFGAYAEMAPHEVATSVFFEKRIGSSDE